MRQTAGVIERRTLRQNRKTGVIERKTPQQNRKTGVIERKTPQQNRKTGVIERKTPQQNRKTGVIERKTPRQNHMTGVSSQQNRVSAREAHALPHSALNIPRTNRETRRMGNALVDAIFHNEEKAEPIFPPARPNAKRRIAAQTSPRAHKRFCRSCNRPNATLRRPTIHDHITQSSASPR